MKISKTIKGNKTTKLVIEFETDEEIGALEDIIVFSEQALLKYFEYRNILPELIANIKKEL